MRKEQVQRALLLAAVPYLGVGVVLAQVWGLSPFTDNDGGVLFFLAMVFWPAFVGRGL